MALQYVTDRHRAAEAAITLTQEPVLGIDIETTGLDPHTSDIRLLQVATGTGKVVVFDLKAVSAYHLAPIFNVPLAAHNATFEYCFLKKAGLPVNRLHDTMLLGRLTQHERLSLVKLSKAVLGMDMDKTEQTSDWSGDLSRSQIEYAAHDALAAVRLTETLLPMVQKAGQHTLYRMWCHALPVLGDLHLQGQSFDWEAHSQLIEHWKQEQYQATLVIMRLMGNINPGSGPQVGAWLSKHLDTKTLPTWPKTATGRLKTDADTLQLFGNLPMIQPLLKYKKVTKLLGTYGISYAKHRHPITGRLHADFMLGSTRSGRVAAKSPNVQNPPRAASFRSLFIPAAGRCLVGADYSQIELRVAALLSKDDAMLRAYRSGEDLHRKTAAAVAGIDPCQVTQAHRTAAKAINFGTLYGQGPSGLARTAKLDYDVDMPLWEARQALNRFALAYPGLAYWQKQQIAMARMYGQVQTKLGLIRDFNVQGVGYLEGESQNIPVQGSAAEVLLSTLARLPDALRGIDARLYHNVHDEAVLDVAEGDADRAARALQAAMVAGFLDVFPEGDALTHDLVDVLTGHNWAEVH